MLEKMRLQCSVMLSDHLISITDYQAESSLPSLSHILLGGGDAGGKMMFVNQIPQHLLLLVGDYVCIFRSIRTSSSSFVCL